MGRERRTRAAHIIFVNVLDLGLGLKQHKAQMLKLISIKPTGKMPTLAWEFFSWSLAVETIIPGPRSHADWLAVKLFFIKPITSLYAARAFHGLAFAVYWAFRVFTHSCPSEFIYGADKYCSNKLVKVYYNMNISRTEHSLFSKQCRFKFEVSLFSKNLQALMV